MIWRCPLPCKLAGGTDMLVHLDLYCTCMGLDMHGWSRGLEMWIVSWNYSNVEWMISLPKTGIVTYYSAQNWRLIQTLSHHSTWRTIWNVVSGADTRLRYVNCAPATIDWQEFGLLVGRSLVRADVDDWKVPILLYNSDPCTRETKHCRCNPVTIPARTRIARVEEIQAIQKIGPRVTERSEGEDALPPHLISVLDAASELTRDQ